MLGAEAGESLNKLNNSEFGRFPPLGPCGGREGRFADDPAEGSSSGGSAGRVCGRSSATSAGMVGNGAHEVMMG